MKVDKMANISIRKMTEADISRVMEIDRLSFPSPWTRQIYEQEVVKNDFAHYFVIETDDEIIGYVGIWIVLEDAQITNIAVLPTYRGKNIGNHLFSFALTYALQQGAHYLSLEVRPTNEVAKNMYRKFGLQEAGIRKNYYPDNGEDAIVMWVNLLEAKLDVHE